MSSASSRSFEMSSIITYVSHPSVQSHELRKSISSKARTDRTNSFSDPSILRGVRLTTLLSKWYTLLRIPPQDSQFSPSDQVAAWFYSTSEEVDFLDWFISHSWRASGWKKYVALLWFINRHVALYCAIVVAVLWSICSTVVPLPRYYVTIGGDAKSKLHFGLSPVVFGIVFITVMLFKPLGWDGSRNIAVFLDKACIHQTDVALKAAGIRSLGAFIKNSKRLLVLWSPDYFSRLWCNYEIATFASLHGVKGIDFLPLYVPTIGLSFLIIRMLEHLVRYVWPQYILGIGFISWFPASAIALRALRGQLQLTQQIDTFSLSCSRCYCCDIDHKLQDGKAILCDRSFVQDNLNAWFSDLGEQEMDGVEAFEHFVRGVVCKQVHFLLGPFGIPLSNFTHLLVIQFAYNVDLILLNSSHWRGHHLFHVVFDSLLIVNIACFLLTMISFLFRIVILARGRLVIDIVLVCVVSLYANLYVREVSIMSFKCYFEDAKRVLILNTSLLFLAAWLNYKRAWQQGSWYPAVICHFSVLVVSLIVNNN